MKQVFSRLMDWQRFYTLMKRGLKVFLFYLTVLSLFRFVFILWMHDYMSDAVGTRDVLMALWRGLRISCQSAGILMLVSLVPAWLCNVLRPGLESRVQTVVHMFTMVVVSVLFVARFPYYRQFHSGFNQLMFNAANDDVYALLISLIKEFYLPVRLAGAFVLAYVLYRALQWLLAKDIVPSLPQLPKIGKWLYRAAFLWGLYILSLLVTFGGSLNWQTAVDWENAGVTKDNFLNEAILDDLQAVYRGYTMNGRLEACNGLNFTTDQIRELTANLTGKPAVSDDLDTYLTRSAQGAQVARPQQIFVIISESYANWPLLDKYKDLHIADEMRALIAEDDTDYCRSFLPNGASTVSAVTGVVTGFADANLYLTTMPEAFAEPYPTASAPQLKRLGYTTNFWYAGPATWERIGAFTKAQGYDHFYSRGDFGDVPGSVWGCDDEYLYEKVLDGVPADQPSFNVVLNVSNHSPYTVDVVSKGFDAEKVKAALPPEVREDQDLLRELGHYWYATQETTKFVKTIKEKYPDSLIVIVGDHADRYNIDKTPSMYERYGIPFIVTGRGVHKGILLPDAAGSQIDIVPTLLEMIAPQGFTYEALGSSLTRTNRQGVNYGFWITHDNIGKADVVPIEPESIDGSNTPVDEPKLQNYIDAIRSVSWWRAKYGPVLDETKLEGRE